LVSRRSFLKNSVICTLSLKYRVFEENKREVVRGFGLCALFGDERRYVWTENLSDEGISDLVSRLRGGEGRRAKKTITLNEAAFASISPVKEHLDDSTDRAAEHLRTIESMAYDFDRRVKDVILVYQDKVQDVRSLTRIQLW
jgi:predicted Zn-dependent protease